MKKAINALGVITIILFVAVAGVLVGSAFVFSGGANVADFFNAFLTSWLKGFTSVVDWFKNIKDFATNWAQYVSFLVAVIFVVFLVLTIVLPCCKKQGKKAFWSFLYFGASVPAIMIFALGAYPVDASKSMFSIVESLTKGDDVLGKVLGWCLVVIPFVLVALMIVHFILLMVSLKKKEEKVEEIKEIEAPEELETLPLESNEPTYNVEAEIEPEPIPVYVPDSNEPLEEETISTNKKEEEEMDIKELASSIKDLVREMVKEELEKRDSQRGPLPPPNGTPIIVQYFGTNVPTQVTQAPVTPVAPIAQQPVPAPAPASEPVKEEVKAEEPAPICEPVKEEVKAEEPAPSEEVKEEPKVEEPEVVVAPIPAPQEEGEEDEKKVYERIPFAQRMKEADKELQDHYNDLKNDILAYGVKSRISNSGDTFRLHTKTYVKITIAGKGLKLYFALDPKAYEGTTLPVGDASSKGAYEDIPLVFKVKSELSLRRAKQLILDAMVQDGLVQTEIGNTDWVKEIENPTVDEDDED